ncbi:MAG: GNAT family N-acetyltransferase [Mycobacteriales bacterium]
MQLRMLEPDDTPASRELDRIAFGVAPPPVQAPQPGVALWGAFDDTGRLVAQATDRHDEQWWHGAVLPVAGVAGVAVTPEARGQGVARLLLQQLLESARERGALLAPLFPTASALYRSLGWELAGTLRWIRLPTAALSRIPRSSAVTTPGGVDEAQQVYDRIAATRSGLLTRRSPLFRVPPEHGLPEGLDGITIVPGRGYLSWSRGEGWGRDAVLTAYDVLALDGEAAQALLGVLGSWGSVAPTLRLRPLAGDALTPLLPWEAVTEEQPQPWMTRPVDLAGLVAAHPWPAASRLAVGLTVLDDACPWNAGGRRLLIEDGRGRLEEADPGDVVLDVRGWALLDSGVAMTAAVRRAGLLSGPSDRDAALDAVFATAPAALLDFF